MVRLNNVVAIASGGYSHSVALRADGTVWTWGYNGFGQLGHGDTTQRPTPTLVAGLTGVAAIAVGYYHTLGLKSDGTVSAWGYNGNGQLGLGDLTQRLVPTAVTTLSAVAAIAAGGTHSLAQGTDGTLRSWGYNAYGQLGIASTVDAKTPQVVSAAAGLKGLTSGGVHVLGLKADATASGWGYNGFGALGDTTTVSRQSPVAVTGYSRGTSPTASYVYDGAGLRTRKTVAGAVTNFTWESSSGLPLMIDDGTSAYVYGPGGQVLEQITGTTVTWFHQDQLGSTRNLTNASGAVVGTATHDPYGRLLASTGTRSAFGSASTQTPRPASSTCGRGTTTRPRGSSSLGIPSRSYLGIPTATRSTIRSTRSIQAGCCQVSATSPGA